MPTELRNIKGGGLHYVAYPTLHAEISSLPRRSSSALVSSTTQPTTRGWSRDQGCPPTRATTTRSTTKEYPLYHSGLHHPLALSFQPAVQLPLHVWRRQEILRGQVARRQHLSQRLQGHVVPWIPLLHLYLYHYSVGCYGMRLYDNAAHDFFYFSDWTHKINHKLSSLQRTHEVVVLEVTLQLYLWVCVYAFPVHLISQPLALVVALIGPRVCALALSVPIFKFAFIDISICEDIQT